MGSKKKHPKQNKKHASHGKKGKAGKRAGKKPVHTAFMTAFTDRFIRNPVTKKQSFMPDIGPAPGPGVGQALQNFAAVIAILAQKEAGIPIPAAAPGSLGEQVITFLGAPDWPSGTAVPEKFNDHRLTIHLYEISVIADEILRAINEGTGGGGRPTAWPPH